MLCMLTSLKWLDYSFKMIGHTNVNVWDVNINRRSEKRSAGDPLPNLKSLKEIITYALQITVLTMHGALINEHQRNSQQKYWAWIFM